MERSLGAAFVAFAADTYLYCQCRLGRALHRGRALLLGAIAAGVAIAAGAAVAAIAAA